MGCDCGFCRDYAKVKRVLKGRNRRHMRALIEELFERLMMTEDDLNYHQAILDGSWPSAVEQLEEGLEKAKAFRREQEAKEAAECQPLSMSSPETK